MKGEGYTFYSPEEVIIAYNEKKADLHAIIKVRIEDMASGKPVRKIIETTVGRVLFNEVVPKEVGYLNELLTKKITARNHQQRAEKNRNSQDIKIP